MALVAADGHDDHGVRAAQVFVGAKGTAGRVGLQELVLHLLDLLAFPLVGDLLNKGHVQGGQLLAYQLDDAVEFVVGRNLRQHVVVFVKYLPHHGVNGDGHLGARLLLHKFQTVVSNGGRVQGGVVRKTHARKASQDKDVADVFVDGVGKDGNLQQFLNFGFGEVDAVSFFAAGIEFEFHQSRWRNFLELDRILDDLEQVHHNLGVGIHGKLSFNNQVIAVAIKEFLVEFTQEQLFTDVLLKARQVHLGSIVGQKTFGLDFLAFRTQSHPRKAIFDKKVGERHQGVFGNRAPAMGFAKVVSGVIHQLIQALLQFQKG